MSVPEDVRERIRAELWQRADELNWLLLTDSDKGKHYQNWTREPQIGGVLAHYMEVSQVRTYIKDAVLKVYSRRRMEDPGYALSKMGLSSTSQVVTTYIKPHGVKLADGKIVCWGRAVNWKLILMALHERSFAEVDSLPYGAVLLQSSAGFTDSTARAVIENAATKLGVRKLAWV